VAEYEVTSREKWAPFAPLKMGQVALLYEIKGEKKIIFI